MEKYSASITSGRHKYRYNYELQRVEQIGKAIRTGRIGGMIGQTVQEQVKKHYPISAAMWERKPEYWAMLIESKEKAVRP